MAKGSGSDFSQAAKQHQAAAKAGKLPPAAGKAPFWQWWGSEASKHSNTTKNGAQEFLSRFHGNAKGFKLPKFEMPVHVDVDFMTPFVTSVKKASRDVWLQLPPPVRQAAPYVGASVGTGMLVFRIQQRRLDHAHAKNKALEQRLEVITTERDDAKILAKELKSQASRPQGTSEMQMVAAVSQATRAAAEAATAAAGAAAICIIDPRNGTYTPVRTTRKPSRRRQTKTAPSSSWEDGDQPMPSPT
ncbi:hypothetical protein WJX77_009384 [Trebouxia sp. C0004]